MTWRTPTLADADALVALVVAAETHDFGDPDYTRADLLEEWAETGVDLARDAWTTDGAYGLLLGTDARAWVHPDGRGRGLGAALAARFEARARETGVDCLKQHLGVRDAGGRALLEGRGYAFTHAYASLALDAAGIAALPAADGVRVARRDEAQAVHDLIVAAFGEGAGSSGRVDALATILARNPDRDLWFVADGGARAASVPAAAPRPADDRAGALRCELRGDRGYIAEVAVHRDHRGRGHAGALIGAAARALLERGARDVYLYVRSTNPAVRLYERLGFTGDWTVAEFRLELPAR